MSRQISNSNQMLFACVAFLAILVDAQIQSKDQKLAVSLDKANKGVLSPTIAEDLIMIEEFILDLEQMRSQLRDIRSQGGSYRQPPSTYPSSRPNYNTNTPRPTYHVAVPANSYQAPANSYQVDPLPANFHTCPLHQQPYNRHQCPLAKMYMALHKNDRKPTQTYSQPAQQQYTPQYNYRQNYRLVKRKKRQINNSYYKDAVAAQTTGSKYPDPNYNNPAKPGNPPACNCPSPINPNVQYNTDPDPQTYTRAPSNLVYPPPGNNNNQNNYQQGPNGGNSNNNYIAAPAPTNSGYGRDTLYPGYQAPTLVSNTNGQGYGSINTPGTPAPNPAYGNGTPAPNTNAYGTPGPLTVNYNQPPQQPGNNNGQYNNNNYPNRPPIVHPATYPLVAAPAPAPNPQRPPKCPSFCQKPGQHQMPGAQSYMCQLHCPGFQQPTSSYPAPTTAGFNNYRPQFVITTKRPTAGQGYANGGNSPAALFATANSGYKK